MPNHHTVHARRSAAVIAVLIGTAIKGPFSPLHLRLTLALCARRPHGVEDDDMRLAAHLAAIALIAFGATGALAAEPTGTWLTEGGKSRIRIADCGGALCGTISWLQEPNDPETGKPKTDKNNPDAGRKTKPLI